MTHPASDAAFRIWDPLSKPGLNPCVINRRQGASTTASGKGRHEAKGKGKVKDGAVDGMSPKGKGKSKNTGEDGIEDDADVGKDPKGKGNGKSKETGKGKSAGKGPKGKSKGPQDKGKGKPTCFRMCSMCGQPHVCPMCGQPHVCPISGAEWRRAAEWLEAIRAARFEAWLFGYDA